MLYVLTGVRGAGKTTLIERLRRTQGALVLQPSTTRPIRFDGESEYDFVGEWLFDKYAWTIEVGQNKYGMRKSEVSKSACGNVFTVFEPMSIGVFRDFILDSRIAGKVVGLDTVESLEEQHKRVGAAPARMMSQVEFDLARSKVLESDYVLRGNVDSLLKQAREIMEIKLN